MKRFVAFVFAVVCLAACQKAPFLTMTGSRSFNFTREGGSQTFAFSCNRDWSVSSSESWIRISPSSGSASDGDITVTITCAPNTTYDPRTATITVTVEDLTETISVSQATGLGLIVSPTSYDLTNAEQSIEIEVQQNVNYTIEIDDACKDWIKKGGTKALSTDKVTFNISANTSYDNREGRITFKQTDGDLVQTVNVRQSQTNGLFITTPDYNLSNESHTLSVEVKANVQFEVTSQADWIKYVETKALTPSTVVLSIEANESYDNRTGTVLVKQTNGDLTGTITISQRQTDYLSIDPKSFEVSNEEQSVSIEVKDNIRYSVVIPDDAKGWISVQSNTQTKALADDKVVLVIAQNLSYDPRSASITIKQVDGPLAETIEIKQAQGEGLFVTTPEYNLSNEAHTLSVELKANVEFEVVSEVSWIDYVETKALSTSTVLLSISANEGYDSRTGKVKIKQKNGSLEETVTINQEQTNGLFATPNSFDLANEEQSVEIEIKDNVSYSVVIPEDAKNWISVQSNTQTKALINDKVVLAIAKNESYDERETSVTIKQTDGPLTETVRIKQAQNNGLFIPTTRFEVLGEGGILEIPIEANVSFDVTPNVEWIHLTQTKALSTSTILLSIDENPTNCSREGETVVSENNGLLSQTITISQDRCIPKGAIDLGIVITRKDGTTYRLFWAECNIGANKPEENGDFFAWGETETKTDYSWSSYKWANGAEDKLIKYCPPNKTEFWDGIGTPDGKTILDPEDDAAHVKLKGLWRTPTAAECDELKKQCSWTRTTKNGINGFEVRSNIVGNTNSIFIPDAGMREDGRLLTYGGAYWTSSLDNLEYPNVASLLDFTTEEGQPADYFRNTGFPIRPVTE